MICEYLPQEDLNSFRMTNKTGANVAAKARFQDLHVMFTEKSFQNLLNISAQPSLSKYVRSIHYKARNGSTSPYSRHHSDMDSDRKQLGSWPEFVPKEILQECWNENSSNIPIVEVFAQAFQNFPSLKNFKIDGRKPREPHDSYTFSEASERVFQEPVCALRVLSSMLAAAGQENRKLNTFTATHIPRMFFLLDTNDLRNLITPTALHLKRIDLSLAPSYIRRKSLDISSGMYNFLAPAANLEHLRVAIDSSHDENVLNELVAIPWDTAVGSIKFQKLRSLSLHNVSGSKEGFSKFLEAHSGTLEHIYMENMTLEGNIWEWADAFASMKIMTALKSVQSRGTWRSSLNTTTKTRVSINMDLPYLKIHHENPETSATFTDLDKSVDFLRKLKKTIEEVTATNGSGMALAPQPS